MSLPRLAFRFLLAACLVANAWAGDGAGPSGASAPAAAPDTHGPGVSSELIRHHRLRHLDARLNVAPEVLRAQCRYESEIATAPAARKVVLTFDDGPEPGQTESILDTLKRHGIPAAFFLVGHKAQEHPELVARIRAEGRHIVGNHSWDHPNFHAIDAAAQAREVEQTRTLLADLLAPAAQPVFFRYPFGNSTCETNTLLRTDGYRIVGWHIDSCDWAFDRAGTVDPKEATICGVLPQHRQDFVGHVLSAVRAHNGGIVLLHEIHPHTVRQLDAVIEALRAAGFGFAALDDAAFASSLR